MKTPKITAAPTIAAADNSEALRRADVEARLRQRRRGAAANVLTGAGGIPAVTRLGEAA